ncbi:hypothetical protein PsorP6_008775 [Peronosclerospora sorghi]|uniref:Uncharacterized protein n=1 Tax=Peronosclerospora sorghi TaxID=230839 RepID=A0ACC0VZ07_9STRA|nr:hypothetical protein PsorP6_008775 [Peronosclerospora sorghi]
MRLVLDDENSHITGNFDVMDCKSGPNRTNAMVVVRIIHLINLDVLVLKQGSATFDVLQSNDNVEFETRQRETLVLLRTGPDAFEEANATCRGIRRVKRQPTVLEDSDMSLTSDQDQSNGDEVKELSVVALLVALAKDMIQRGFETSKSTGCGWIGQAILDPWLESRLDNGARLEAALKFIVATLHQSVIPDILTPAAASAEEQSLVDFKKRYFATLAENAQFTIETLSKIPGLDVVVPQGSIRTRHHSLVATSWQRYSDLLFANELEHVGNKILSRMAR